MPKFRVRMSCEYSLDVEASSPEEAEAKATESEQKDWALPDWEQAWSEMEVEAVEPEKK